MVAEVDYDRHSNPEEVEPRDGGCFANPEPREKGLIFSPLSPSKKELATIQKLCHGKNCAIKR